MARLGVRLDPSPQFTAQDSLELALLAEEQGYESVWVPEGAGRDSLTQLSAFAMATSRVCLGTGILPVFLRTPTLMAMSAAGLDMISGHRFILGLGVGHQGAVEENHGISFEQPVARIKETVEIVRRLLKGKQFSYSGRVFTVQDGSLGFERKFSVPIYIAAMGPQMIELAGEVADGVLLNWAAPSYLEEALDHLARGASRAGRKLEEIDVACYIRVAVTTDIEAARAPLCQQILRYCSMDYYRKSFVRTGFGEEVQAIGRYLAQSDRPMALAAITDSMQRQLAVFGDREFCQQEIEKYRSLGIKLPIVAPFAVGDAMHSYRTTIEALSG